MRVKIYQIDPERDKQRHIFCGLEELKVLSGSTEIDPTIYERVFNAQTAELDLEDIFTIFNTVSHPLYCGTHMSVSDVVVIEESSFYKGAYFCDSIGFKKIDFDETKAESPERLFKIVYVEPGRPAYAAEVENSYIAESNAVLGYLEVIHNGDGTLIVCNEEGKIKGLHGNRHLDDGVSVVAGPFFIIGEAGEDFRSLTDEEISKYVQKYSEPEDISDDETQADSGITLLAFN